MDADRHDNQPIWCDAFRKILALEAHKGYADNAVSGGIRRFIARWEPDLRDYLADENRAGHLIEQSYRDLDPDQRRDWVAGWQSALDGVAVAASSTPDPPIPADRPTLPDPVDPPTPSSTPATPSETPGLFAPGETAPMVRYRRRPHVPPTAGASPVDPDQPVSTLRRMDGKTVQRLEQLDVRSVRDLLHTLPRRYDDRADIASIADVYPGDTFTVEGQLVDIRSANVGQRRLQLTEGVLRDDTGHIELQWFGQGYLARSLQPGDHMVVTGKVEIHRGRLSISASTSAREGGSPPPTMTAWAASVMGFAPGRGKALVPSLDPGADSRPAVLRNSCLGACGPSGEEPAEAVSRRGAYPTAAGWPRAGWRRDDARIPSIYWRTLVFRVTPNCTGSP